MNFANLKKIDRASVKLSDSPIFKSFDRRQSRVTISGDSAFFYEKDEEQEK